MPALDPLIGTVVADRYVIEAALGAGMMGHVYRARHQKIRRPVAIKLLHAHLCDDPVMLGRLRREATLAGTLSHPNIVGVLDVGELGDRHFIVMEYAEGRELTELLGAPLPRARILHLMSGLFAGLDHAHGAGLIHRDFKPDNVIVTPADLPRIVDFGIALRGSSSDADDPSRLTSPGMVVGTPVYMAPEQARGGRLDARVDLFAAGVILYEMLAGHEPFTGTPLQIAMQNMHDDPPPIGADPELEALMRHLMAREPDERVQTAHEALARITSLR
jgi:serine/threonine-protein kinase